MANKSININLPQKNICLSIGYEENEKVYDMGEVMINMIDHIDVGGEKYFNKDIIHKCGVCVDCCEGLQFQKPCEQFGNDELNKHYIFK